MQYWLGIDNGGTMTKAALFTADGAEVASASRETPVETPQTGYYERDMDALWETTAACIREALGRADIDGAAVMGVGCTGHGKGLYLWGRDGCPAAKAVASTDKRALSIVSDWERRGVAQAAAARTLQPVTACQPAALLAWFQQNRPAVLENTRWIFEAKDYIRFRLTGEALAEATDYSGTSLMDLHTGGFSRELLELWGLRELYDRLPPPCLSYDNAGCVTREAAKQTGLLPGTPVCGGMFDIDACAVAMDVTVPERLCSITGTWSINEYPSPLPAPGGGTTRTSLFCVPGLYLIEESSPTSAGNLEWVLQQFMRAEGQEAKQKGNRLYDMADSLVGGCPPETCDAVFLPYLYGCPEDIPVQAAFIGLNSAHSIRHILRAVYEGVVFSHLAHIEKLLSLRQPPEAVRLAGGAVNSRIWTQMFADILGLPVETVRTRELGAKGSAMAAAVATGLYRDYHEAAAGMVRVAERILPQDNHRAVYRRKYERYRQASRLLMDMEVTQPCLRN